ncbi:hypothetical protein BJ875DRAFT_367985, partial [Amylocarpus encephaloides]
SYGFDKLSIPASLRRCIYGLACAFWSQDPFLRGFPPISQPEPFEHAHAALNRELDSPKLATLQACLLILHQQPDMSGTTESPRIWVLACQATACAQSLGLHQDPTEWELPRWENRLRKRLWWIVVIHDVRTSICHGNTPHIVPGSFDTTDLTMDDITFDEYVMGVRGSSMVGRAHFMAGQAKMLIYTQGFDHIGVFAVSFLILRQLTAPATRESKSDPTSNLWRHFDLALSEGEAFVQYAAQIFALDLHVFHPRRKSCHPESSPVLINSQTLVVT